MKAILIYKNEINGELDSVDEIDNINEWLASELMNSVLDKQQSRVNNFLFAIKGELITVKTLRWIKKGDRYSLYKLVGMELI